MASRKSNERRSRRYALRNCSLTFTRANLFSFLRRGKKGPAKQPLVNLSLTGLQFLTRQKMRLEEKLRLFIDGVEGAPPVALEGRVVWTRQVPRQGIQRVGVEFTRVSHEAERSLEALESCVQDLALRVVCSGCGAAFTVKRRYEGARGRCPKCNRPVEVVDREAEAAAFAVLAEAKRPPTRVHQPVLSQKLPEEIQKFIQRAVPSRLHLAVLQHLTIQIGLGTVTSTKHLARSLQEKEHAIEGVLKHFSDWYIAKKMGVKAYNFAPIGDTKKKVLELMRLCKNPQKRGAVLATVIASEKDLKKKKKKR